jgi:putative membrane protein
MRLHPLRTLAAVSVLNLSLLTAEPARADGLNDAQILAIYVQVNTFDIETALLGRAQARSASLQTLAAHIASDHAGVRQGAYDLAAQCGVTLELPAARTSEAIDHGKTLVRLLALDGDAFDKAYLQYELAFHRAAIDAVRSALLPAAHCAALRAHLEGVLPAFEHHLAMTQALATNDK